MDGGIAENAGAFFDPTKNHSKYRYGGQSPPYNNSLKYSVKKRRNHAAFLCG